MKKLVSFLLVILIMLPTSIIGASADDYKLYTHTGAITAGSELLYTVYLEYGDDYSNKLAIINAIVKYDKDVLKATDLFDVEFPLLGPSTVCYRDPGEIGFNNASGLYGFTGFKDGGVLITVKFTVIQDADDTSIEFYAPECVGFTLNEETGNLDASLGRDDITSGLSAQLKKDNEDEDRVNFLRTNTSTISAGSKLLYTVHLKYGDDYLHKLTTINATIKYDSDVLQIESGFRDIAFPILGASTVCNSNTPGEVIFDNSSGVYGFTGLKDGGEIITINFTVKQNVYDTTIDFWTNDCFGFTIDAETGNVDESKSRDDITSGFYADYKITPIDTDSDIQPTDTDTVTDSEVKPTDTDTVTDSEVKPTDTDTATDSEVTPTDTDTTTESDTSTDNTDIDQPLIIRGDVDGDGVVAMGDVIAVQKYVAGLISFNNTEFELADVDAPYNEITMTDVTSLQKYIAKLYDVFPVDSFSYIVDIIKQYGDDTNDKGYYTAESYKILEDLYRNALEYLKNPESLSEDEVIELYNNLYDAWVNLEYTPYGYIASLVSEIIYYGDDSNGESIYKEESHEAFMAVYDRALAYLENPEKSGLTEEEVVTLAEELENAWNSLEYTREYLLSMLQYYIDLFAEHYEIYKTAGIYEDVISAYDNLSLCATNFDNYTSDEIVDVIDIFYNEALEAGIFN